MTNESFVKMIERIKSKVDQNYNVITEADLQGIVKEFGLDDNSYNALVEYLDNHKIIVEKEAKEKKVTLDDLEQEKNLDESNQINQIIDDSNKNYSRIYQSIRRFAKEHNIDITKEQSMEIAGRVDFYTINLQDIEKVIKDGFESYGIVDEINDDMIKVLAKRIYGNISSKDTEETFLSDPVKMYLRDIARFPVYSEKQERDVFEKLDQLRDRQRELKERLKDNQDEESEKELDRIEEKIIETKKEIVNHNLRLVVSIAKRKVGQGVDILDLIQEGNDGLMKACDRFDVSKGFRFSTYATWWISQCTGRSIANDSRTIRVPVHAHEQINKIKRYIREYLQEFGRDPSNEELADLMDLPLEKINKLRLIEMNNSLLSLDQPLRNNDGDEDTTIGDMQKDEEEISIEEKIYRQELIKIVSEMYDELNYKERLILGNRFGTYEEFSDCEIEAMKIKYLLSKLKRNKSKEEVDLVEKKYVATNKKLNDMSRDKVRAIRAPKPKTNKQKKEQLERLIAIEDIRNPYSTKMTEKYKKALEAVADYNVLFEKDRLLHGEPLNVGTYLLLQRDYKNELDLANAYFLHGSRKTLEEIGRVMGVTRERIRQIEAKGLDKVRIKSRKRLKDYNEGA